VRLSYVLPLRCEAGGCDHDDLRAYLEGLAPLLEVIVVDGSPPGILAEHRGMWPAGVRHLLPDAEPVVANGKVGGVTSGIRAASYETVILADEDVRYRPEQLREIGERMRTADLVVPDNAFDPSTAWHARWDTARTLLNRAVGHDYPGTLAVRRSTFHRIGGYDGDVLFENLELIRTVRAFGSIVRAAPDVIVARRPPSTTAFLGQRIRQAYDDLAQPVRLVTHLALLPATIVLARRRSWGTLGTAAAVAVGLAEIGRRRHGGRDAYPPSASFFAPAWLAERAICVWVAVGSRVSLGGCRYRGRTIRRAATSRRALRRRAGRQPVVDGARDSAAACAPSQSGFVRDRPHRQSATTARRISSSSPSSSTSRTGPRTR
jgi:hypothetical protein